MWEGEALYAPSVWAAYNNGGGYNCSAPQEEERRLHEIMLRVRHTLTLDGNPPPPGGATPQAGPSAGAFSGGLSDSLPPV